MTKNIFVDEALSQWHQHIATIIPKNKFLRFHEDLKIGFLGNGLEYRILSHKFPPGRVQSYLVVAAGSLHEADDEQGLAHFLEHCVFLGTEKFRTVEELKAEMAYLGMSFGGDLNAHTDFHETVYTLSCPTSSHRMSVSDDEMAGDSSITPSHDDSREDASISSDMRSRDSAVNVESNDEYGWDSNVYRCINLLQQLGFEALLNEGTSFLNEKSAVISEEQLRNSVQYRVEKRLLKQLHSRCILPERMPIGCMDQVANFTAKNLRKFYQRWYVPANMCVIVVGDVNSEDVEKMIISVFDGGNDQKGVSMKDADKSLSSALLEKGSPEGSSVCEDVLQQDKYGGVAVRRVVTDIVANEDVAVPATSGTPFSLNFFNNWLHRPGRLYLPNQTCSFYKPAEQREVVFQHDLLRLVCVTIATLLPMLPIVDEREAFVSFVDTIASHIFHTRLDDVLKTRSRPPFVSAGWDFVNSARENCAWNAFGITCRPSDWREGLACAVGEISRLSQFGVGQAELHWALSSVMKEYRDSSRQSGSESSSDLISDIAEDWISGTVTMSKQQDYELAKHFVNLVDREIINQRFTEIFNFVTSYFDPLDLTDTLSELNSRGSIFVAGPMHKLASNSDNDANLMGPSIECVVTTPGLLKNQSALNTKPLTTVDEEDILSSVTDEPLILDVHEVTSIIKTALINPADIPHIELPESLLNEDDVVELLKLLQPQWIQPQLWKTETITQTLYGGQCYDDMYIVANSIERPKELPKRLQNPIPELGEKQFRLDPLTRITLGRLSNGVRLTYKKTLFEPNRCSIRVFFSGGRGLEHELNLKPQLLSLGLKTLLDGGIGTISQHVLSRMISLWGFEITGSVDYDGITLLIDLDAAEDDQIGGGLLDAFALIHGLINKPLWDRETFERQKHNMITSYESSIANLDFKTSLIATIATFPNTPSMVPAEPSIIANYTFEEAQSAVLLQLQSKLIEINVVGDFNEAYLRAVCWRYLGSLPVNCSGKDDANCEQGEQSNAQAMLSKFIERYDKTGEILSKDAELFTSNDVISVFLEDKKSIFIEEKVPDIIPTKTDIQKYHKEPVRCSLNITFHGFGRYSSPSCWISAKTPKRWNDPSFRFRVWRIIEGLINERLYVEIREKRGLCYAADLGTVCFDFTDRGTISIGSTPMPHAASETLDALLQVISELITTCPPTEREFLAVSLTKAVILIILYRQAKKPIISGIKSNLNVNEYWLSLVFGLQLPQHPKVLPQIHRIEECYKAITLEDVQFMIKNDLKLFPMIIILAMSGPLELQTCIKSLKEEMKNKILIMWEKSLLSN